MADRNTTIRASQLRNFTISAEDLKINSITGDKFIDDTISGSKIADKAISEPKLDIANNPVDGYYLKYTTASGMEWFAGGGGVSDHGSLTGLADDDHTQYLLANGTRNISGNITQDDGFYIATAEVRATSVSGLALKDDAGNLAIFIEDGGKVGIGGITNPVSSLDVKTTFGFWNSAETRGLVQAWQANYTSWAYYNGSGWTYPMVISDLKANLSVGFMDGWVGLANIKTNYIEAYTGTSINEFSTDTTLAGNSDNTVPTEKAVKTYIASEIGAIDHGSIGGLGDDDHTIYLLADGTRNISGNITQNDGLYIATDEVRARDSGGLRLTNDAGGEGLLISDGGNIWIGNGQYILTDDVRARDSGGLYLKDDAGSLGVFIEDGGQVGVDTNTPSSKFEVWGGTLASGVDSTVDISEFSVTDNNDTRVLIQAKRNADGSNWETDDLYIMKKVDVVNQAYLKFTEYGLALGTGGGTPTDKLSITSDGKVSLMNGTSINEFSTDTTLSGNSDDAVPTEKAAKAYVDELFGAGGQIKHAVIKTGQYTGDGTTSKAITGLGFRPKYVRIVPDPTSEAAELIWEKSDQDGIYAHYHPSIASGYHATLDNRIISLDADGFTVDDDGVDGDPNKLSAVYDYMAIGEETSIVVGDVASANSTVAMVETGTYTGDGATSKVISLADSSIVIKAMWITLTPNSVADGTATSIHFCDDNMSANRGVTHMGGGGHQIRDNEIISIGTGTFTVDDDGVNANPNKLNQVYHYTVVGTKTITAVAATNVPSYVKVTDTKAAGTAGGTFTSGAWRTRTLNTEDSDPDGVCSLSSNQITLSAGTYECSIIAPVFRIGNHQARLYNTTGSVVILEGTHGYALTSAGDIDHSYIKGRFTIAASQALEVQHQCASTYATNGFGPTTGYCTNTVFTIAEFRKVG